MEISREVGINPGLDPVVQVTDVDVAALTGQLMPSMVMLYAVVSVEKLIPVYVTTVPPVTVPYLGLMESSLVVKVLEYVTLLVTLVTDVSFPSLT